MKNILFILVSGLCVLAMLSCHKINFDENVNANKQSTLATTHKSEPVVLSNEDQPTKEEWLTYRNEKYAFEIDYPKSWLREDYDFSNPVRTTRVAFDPVSLFTQKEVESLIVDIAIARISVASPGSFLRYKTKEAKIGIDQKVYARVSDETTSDNGPNGAYYNKRIIDYYCGKMVLSDDGQESEIVISYIDNIDSPLLETFNKMVATIRFTKPIPPDPWLQAYPEEISVSAQASAIMTSLANKNITKLAYYIHPQKGLRFSRGRTKPKDDLIATKESILEMSNSQEIIYWGLSGNGSVPIEMTFDDYFKNHIYDLDYKSSKYVSYNKIIGNRKKEKNLFEIYPESKFVEYLFSGFEEDSNGSNWAGLRLILENYHDQWYLVGIVKVAWFPPASS